MRGHLNCEISCLQKQCKYLGYGSTVHYYVYKTDIMSDNIELYLRSKTVNYTNIVNILEKGRKNKKNKKTRQVIAPLARARLRYYFCNER